MPALTLLLLNLAFIGLLPRIFFRRGRLTLMWWVTAAPLFLCAAFLLLAYRGLLPPWNGGGAWLLTARQVLAVALSAGSIALIAFTLGTHQRPLNLWHQREDAPQHLVTGGAYRRIRHPFYAAFLLALLAALALSPQVGTLATFIWGLVQLTRTAAKEERTLKASSLGEQYERYMHQAGRFLPRWRRVTA
jgi:protein-S-isoprenylcysteine O-methyltransferase Ste14